MTLSELLNIRHCLTEYSNRVPTEPAFAALNTINREIMLKQMDPRKGEIQTITKNDIGKIEFDVNGVEIEEK